MQKIQDQLLVLGKIDHPIEYQYVNEFIPRRAKLKKMYIRGCSRTISFDY